MRLDAATGRIDLGDLALTAGMSAESAIAAAREAVSASNPTAPDGDSVHLVVDDEDGAFDVTLCWTRGCLSLVVLSLRGALDPSRRDQRHRALLQRRSIDTEGLTSWGGVFCEWDHREDDARIAVHYRI